MDTQGDSFFVAFSRASDAIACAIAAQQNLAAAIWPERVAVRVRMGIHTGEPLAAGAGVGYVGMDVHRAARIANAGHGGQVLISGTTRDVVTDALPKEIQLIDLGEHRLKDLRTSVRIYQATAAGLQNNFAPLVTAAAEEPPPTPGEAPYRGLAAFEETDADKFFGREDLVAQLGERAGKIRFLALIGASGSGKSSILRAGLIPRARDTVKFGRVLLLTPTAHPFEELAAAIDPDATPTQLTSLMDELRNDSRALALALRTTKRGVILAVDQLEEIFTLTRDESERQAFLDSLAYAAGLDEGGADEPPDADRAAVVVTLRADFYAYLAPYDQIRTAAAASQAYVGQMTPSELRRAIEEPARLGGWEFAPGLVDLLLRDVGDEPGALPLLSHALLETWQRRRGVTMTLRSYAESGGVKGAIARTADRVYEGEFNDPQRRIARDVFIRLTELGEGAQDTRRRVRLDELIPSDETRAAEARMVIKALADARLVTVGEETVEVAHEALIREWPTLREWLRSDRDNLRIHRRLTEAATEWEVAGRDESLLYRGARLAQARESTQYKGALNPLEHGFLDASVAAEEADELEREAAQRREIEAAQALAAAETRRAEEAARSAGSLRRRAFLLTGALGLAAVLAVVAVALSQQSGANATLAAQRAAEAQTNADLAEQRAREASDNADLAHQREQEAHDSEAAAQEQTRLATAHRLGADATQVLLTGREPDLSALLALAALDKGYTPEADAALQRASRQSSGRLYQHNGPVIGVAISPDGATLYSAADDGLIHIWDTHSGEEQGTLPMPPSSDIDPYWQVWLSSDGTTILAGDYFDSMVLYSIDQANPANSQPIATDCPEMRGQAIRAMSGDGRVVAAFSDDVVTVVRLEDCAPVGPAFSATQFNDPALNADGTRLVASVEENAKMFVWDTTTGKPISQFTQITAFWHPSFSTDGSRVVTGTFDGTAHMFDSETGLLLQTYAGHSAAVERAIFTPDGSRVVTTSEDGTARMWDATLGTEVRRFVHAAAVRQTAVSPDGLWVYTASDDTTVRGWSAAGESFTFSAGQGAVAGISFSPDARRISTASRDGVQIYDLTSNEFTLSEPMDDPGAVAFSPSGDTLLAVADDGTFLLDPDTGEPIHMLSPAGVLSDGVAASFSADGSLILASSAATHHAQYLYDAATGELLKLLLMANGVLSVDGTRVAGWDEGRFTIYDTETGETIKLISLDDTDSFPIDIQLTPDGSKIVTGDHDSVVRVRDVMTAATELEMKGHTGPIRQVRVSADGQYALSAGFDGTARLWDLDTGELVRLFPGHEGRAVTAIAISGDGQLVALGSADGKVIVTPASIGSLESEVCGRLEYQLTDVDRAAYGLDPDLQPCP